VLFEELSAEILLSGCLGSDAEVDSAAVDSAAAAVDSAAEVVEMPKQAMM